MRLSRLLAWEVLLVHGLTGGLFLAAMGILLANASLDVWWAVALLAPIAVASFLGWLYEGWIILRGTEQLRRGDKGGEDDQG